MQHIQNNPTSERISTNSSKFSFKPMLNFPKITFFEKL